VIWLDDTNVALCIADVSGKGISAAMLMSNFQANLRVLVQYTPDLKVLINLLNQKVIDNSNGERFITFLLVFTMLKQGDLNTSIVDITLQY